jgi:hypothetical protein
MPAQGSKQGASTGEDPRLIVTRAQTAAGKRDQGGKVTVCEPGGLKSLDMSALINKENERETYPSVLVAPSHRHSAVARERAGEFGSVGIPAMGEEGKIPLEKKKGGKSILK